MRTYLDKITQGLRTHPLEVPDVEIDPHPPNDQRTVRVGDAKAALALATGIGQTHWSASAPK